MPQGDEPAAAAAMVRFLGIVALLEGTASPQWTSLLLVRVDGVVICGE